MTGNETEYERLAKIYFENIKAIKEVVMSKLEKNAVITAKKVAINAIKDEPLEYRALSKVYNCEISDKCCANICSSESYCKDCETMIVLKGRKD